MNTSHFSTSAQRKPPLALTVQVPGEGFDLHHVLDVFEGQLARFKHPREVAVVAALPRNALGKLDLPALRALVLPDQ